MSFQGVDVRATTDRLVFRALLLDSASAFVTTGTTVLRLHEIQTDGTFKTYDFDDNTFKTGACTTPTSAMTHRTGNNATYDTGVWTVALTTLTGFTVGNIYLATVNNSLATAPNQVREFQFGNAEGNLLVSALGGADLNLEQANDTTPTADTTGDALFNASRSLPNNIVPGASGGLPYVDGSNRVAGIVGTRYNTLDDLGSSRLLSTTAAAGSTTTVVNLTAVAGTDANDDFNGALIIIRDVSDSNRVYFDSISDYVAASNVVTLTGTCTFTPVAGDLVEVFAAATTSTILAEILKLTTGFSATNPNNLNSFLKAIMSKAATVPASVGTYDPTTDSLEAEAERSVLSQGSGFVTSTDSLQAIRDAIDVLVAPAVVTNTSVSGSGLISDSIGLIRRAIDEPSTAPKYTNADIVEFMQAAFDVILADLNSNTDHPILVRHNITLSSGVQTYYLPPTCASVWRVAKINSGTGLVDWEVWPGTEFSGHGQGFSLEGNALRLLSDWKSTETLQILYVPNADVSFHKGTIEADDVGADITTTTIKFAATATDGTLSTTKNAYAGYLVRILTSSTSLLEERLCTSYDRATRIATIDIAWDTEPAGGTAVTYEVVPQYTRLLKHVICLRAAIDVLAQEGNAKRMQTLGAALQVKMSALRRYVSGAQARFPHSANSDTMDNASSLGGW